MAGDSAARADTRDRVDRTRRRGQAKRRGSLVNVTLCHVRAPLSVT